MTPEGNRWRARTGRGTVMLLSVQKEAKPNSRLVFNCLILTTSGVDFFDFFYPPWSLLQKKKAPHFHELSFPHFPPFWSTITAVCNCVDTCKARRLNQINLGTTKSRPIILENLALVTTKSLLKSVAITKFVHFLSYCANFIERLRLNGPP